MTTVYSQKLKCPQASNSWFCSPELPDGTECALPLSTSEVTTMPYSAAICQDKGGCEFAVCPNLSSDPKSEECVKVSVDKGKPLKVYGNCGADDIIRGQQINNGGPPGPQISSPSPFDSYQCVQDFNLPASVKSQMDQRTPYSYYVCDSDKCIKGKKGEKEFMIDCMNS